MNEESWKIKEIIGFKLIKHEYLQAFNAIVGHAFMANHFIINSDFYNKAKESGVLDLWFEPIYKDESIKIGGYEVKFKSLTKASETFRLFTLSSFVTYI